MKDNNRFFPQYDIRKLIRIQIGVILIFILFKAVRPAVLESKAPDFLKTFLLSFPNFCEAVAGTLTVTAILLWINFRLIQPRRRPALPVLYTLSVALAAIFVLLQEFKIHNLGGYNVYDPMDVLYSVIGLVVVFVLLFWLKPGTGRSGPEFS